MKKTLLLAIVLLLAANFSACARKVQEPQAKLKCPACGYEFEVPHGR